MTGISQRCNDPVAIVNTIILLMMFEQYTNCKGLLYAYQMYPGPAIYIS